MPRVEPTPLAEPALREEPAPRLVRPDDEETREVPSPERDLLLSTISENSREEVELALA